MDKRIRYNNSKREDVFKTRNGFEDDLVSDIEDCALFETIGNFMKGQADLDDVHNDIAFQSTQEAVKELISDYNKNKSGNRENEKFIRDILAAEVFAEFKPQDVAKAVDAAVVCMPTDLSRLIAAYADRRQYTWNADSFDGLPAETRPTATATTDGQATELTVYRVPMVVDAWKSFVARLLSRVYRVPGNCPSRVH